MEEHKYSSKKPKVVVGDVTEVPRLSKRTYTISIVAGVFAVTGVACLVLFLSTRERTPNPISDTKIAQAVHGTVENPDYIAVETELKKRLESEKNPKKKADIYIRLASISMQQKHYSKAADQLIAAGRSDTSRADSLAGSVADAYAMAGNKQDALPYYKKSLEYYSSQPDTLSGRQYYLQTITKKIEEIEK